jgi:hypothetical protein
MPISKTDTVNCQQKSDTHSDFVQAQRRRIYPTKFQTNRNTALENLFSSHVPNKDFLFLRKNALALCILRHHLTKSNYEYVQLIDGSKTIIVDLAETRWTSQQSFADLFGVEVRAISRTEKGLKDSGIIVSEIVPMGFKKRRYLALSKVTMAWLRVGVDLPKQKNVNDSRTTEKRYSGLPKNGTPHYRKVVPENKEQENKRIRIYDDETPPKQPNTAPPNQPVVIEDPEPVRRPRASSYKKLEYPGLGAESELTDLTTIQGNKPWPQLNRFWSEAIKKYGESTCRDFLQTDHKFRWSQETRKTILSSLSQISDPKAYEQKTEAQEAKQASMERSGWNRSDWISTIVKLERGENPDLPSSTCPADLKAEFDQLVNKP